MDIQDEKSKLLKVGSLLLTGLQFDDISDLDLPKNFGKRRYRNLKSKIESHNDSLRRAAINIKQIYDSLNTNPTLTNQ